MMSADNSVIELARWARAVARADSPAKVFKTLLEASRAAVPRACVFLVRRGDARGWGSVGYPTDQAQAQRAFRAALDQGWLGDVAREAEGAPCPRPAEADDPDFGQTAAADAVGCVIGIDGNPIALVIGERTSDESPWLPEGLALLTGVAQLRLEVNLAGRRAAAAEADTATKAPSEPEGDAPQEDTVETSEEQAPEIELARRYARLVATDIRLYNEEAVMLGRRNGDLAERIGEHIDRGKETFVRRHGDLGSAGMELLHEAYVQVLAAGDAALIPPSLLE
jgi:hypothetical protein